MVFCFVNFHDSINERGDAMKTATVTLFCGKTCREHNWSGSGSLGKFGPFVAYVDARECHTAQLDATDPDSWYVNGPSGTTYGYNAAEADAHMQHLAANGSMAWRPTRSAAEADAVREAAARLDSLIARQTAKVKS